MVKENNNKEKIKNKEESYIDKEKNYKFKEKSYDDYENKVNTLRLNNITTKNIYLISKEENLSKSDTIRMLLEKSIKDYKLNKALEFYKKGEVDFSVASEIAGLSVREFLEALKSSGTGLNIPLEMTEYGFNSMIKMFGKKRK